MSEDQINALEEFRHTAREYIANPCTGTKYAMNMAAVELQLLGLDPERVTPTGYVEDLLE